MQQVITLPPSPHSASLVTHHARATPPTSYNTFPYILPHLVTPHHCLLQTPIPVPLPPNPSTPFLSHIQPRFCDTGLHAHGLVTQTEQNSWDFVFNSGNRAEKLVNYANYDLSREKLMCMNIGKWLNVEVINLYMILLQARHLLIKT